MKVADFTCPQGHTHERFLTADIADMDVSICPQCRAPAPKRLSMPRVVLEGWSGSFPGAAMKWDKQHEDAHAKHVKEYGPDSERV